MDPVIMSVLLAMATAQVGQFVVLAKLSAQVAAIKTKLTGNIE